MIHALLDRSSLLANDGFLAYYFDSIYRSTFLFFFSISGIGRDSDSVSMFFKILLLPSSANRHDRARVNNLDAFDVRIFQTGHSSCGGGIGSNVRSC